MKGGSTRLATGILIESPALATEEVIWVGCDIDRPPHAVLRDRKPTLDIHLHHPLIPTPSGRKGVL